MDIRSLVKFSKGSSRKVKRMVDLIRGKNLEEAINTARFLNLSASAVVYKILNSAFASAKKMNLNPSTLFVKEVYATQGPTTKRFIAGSRGNAKPVRYKTSHITVVIGERGGA